VLSHIVTRQEASNSLQTRINCIGGYQSSLHLGTKINQIQAEMMDDNAFLKQIEAYYDVYCHPSTVNMATVLK